jgi:hypothetical protein
MMKAADIARGEYRDAAQEGAHTAFRSVTDLQGLAERMRSSQQGLRPTVRPLSWTRSAIAAGVLSQE